MSDDGPEPTDGSEHEFEPSITAEAVVERHEDVLEEWAEEETFRGEIARGVLAAGRGETDA